MDTERNGTGPQRLHIEALADRMDREQKRLLSWKVWAALAGGLLLAGGSAVAAYYGARSTIRSETASAIDDHDRHGHQDLRDLMYETNGYVKGIAAKLGAKPER